MLACYYQIDTINHNQTRYRYIDVRTMLVPIDNKKIRAILPAILSEICGATAVGYNKTTDSYWCKITHYNICLLHAELQLVQSSNKNTQIIISLYIGGDQTLANFVSNFAESIELYTSSSFFRTHLDKFLDP